MKKILYLVLILLIINVVFSETMRYISNGESGAWVAEYFGHTPPGPGAVPIRTLDPPDSVIRTNLWDRTVTDSVCGYFPSPWSKLYESDNAYWIGWDRFGYSPYTTPAYYRYILRQIQKRGTVSRAVIWLAVDDIFEGAELRSMTTGRSVGVLPIPDFAGYWELRRFDITDFFRSIPDDLYQLEIWIKDDTFTCTGLICYLAIDNDTIRRYTMDFRTGWQAISFPFYFEGYPSWATLGFIFRNLDSVMWQDENGVLHKHRAGLVRVYGPQGDSLRHYALMVKSNATAAIVCTVSYIYEKRYLDCKSNLALFFSSVACTIPWPADDSPDDLPDTKILRSRTFNFDAGGNPVAIKSCTAYVVQYPRPFACSLPYSFDLRCPSSSSSSASGSSRLRYVSYPPSDSMVARLNEPDTVTIHDTTYYREMVESLRVWELIDYYRSSPSTTPGKSSIISPRKWRIEAISSNGKIDLVIKSPSETRATIKIYDIAGKLERSVSDIMLSKGVTSFEFHVNTSGVYIIKVYLPEGVIERKVTVIR